MTVNPTEEKFDPDKYYEENVEPYIKSKGTQKMWNYFLDVMKKDYFIEVIRTLRLEYEIPDTGFNSEDGHCYRPPHNFKNEEKLRKEIIEKICKKYKLHNFDYSDVILDFIYYNQIHPVNELGACGLFRVSDVIEEKEDPFGELTQQSDDATYPIAIRISPYASQRDIVDFIKNKVIWKKEIEFLQNKYKDKGIKIGKIKTKNKNIQQRNSLILRNRKKPLKEIRKMLAQQKIFLDDGHISKIISLEKQARKEV